jgi:hypothetical protein
MVPISASIPALDATWTSTCLQRVNAAQQKAPGAQAFGDHRKVLDLKVSTL